MKDFGLHIPIHQPCEISWKDDSVLAEFTQKLFVQWQENFDDAVVKEIVKMAKAEGITDVVILNKPAIIEALKKQTAMKPLCGFWYKCPACKVGINTENGNPHYCEYCGQKIDWSEEE